MTESSNFNDIVAKPLTEETKDDWFEWVGSYLISQDLWEVTSSSSTRPDENGTGEDYARWRRKNAAALQVIRISCGPHNLPVIRGVSESKVAWDILYRTYHSPPPPPPRDEDIEMGILYKAISNNDWSCSEAFIRRYPIVLNVEFCASRGETPLHVAAKFGHVGIVEELVKLVEPKYLEIYDASGDTPFTIAAGHSGVIPIAECLINKSGKALLAISRRDNKWDFPVLLAFWACLKEMGRYLYSVTPSQFFTENPNRGATFLGTCLVFGELDIVLDLLRQCKELLFVVDFGNLSTIEMIALFLPDSLDKSQLPFWKRWVYDYIKIPSTTTTEHLCAEVRQDGDNNKAHQGLGLLHRLISSINNLLGMKEICKMKKKHAQAAAILNLVCENVMFLNEEKMAKTRDALISAARAEKVEFLLRVTKANPELVSLVTFPQLKGHVFFDAVRVRKAGIFNLLHGFRFKHVVATMTRGCNHLMDAAASLGPPSYLNQISGAALQMQRELQWFKAAESMVDHGHWEYFSKWQRPFDLFKENHKELRKEGERWMKDTASSCSVVGALIVTIMFAVAFTIPGGNDQASGIFTSRYAEEDFLYSLPRKLIIGLSTLFLSIATMMVTFSVTIVIMLQHNSSLLRAFLPIAMLGGVPITLFVLLQFPLLVEVISSTYGPGIVKKKVEKWP
ncbi:hypothetical protein QN277_007737 [Acacia crassicarpa]|uniref:PGG domain-containing protein n=1 Tax=Acacia crassicarpa TaxID=499986 RepID=A0AAE1IWI3_9FABA|nr:hypothetical protein QN277_007737 [Acacia crassicarpa]